jgi:thiosulfate dehydrogenase
MTARRTMAILGLLGAATGAAFALDARRGEPLAKLPLAVARGAEGGWTSRAVFACDRRKAVVVEGVRPGERLERRQAQQVAALLQDLMRFCEEEVTARLGVNEVVTLSVNGRPYVEWVPGSELPFELAHGKVQHTAREQAIWKAELDKLVAEGDRLFHSDEIGTNGIACAMCHPDASNSHPETYPKFQTQLKKVALLRDMVNWCIENPLEGKPIAGDDPRMKALEAYMLVKRAGVALEAGKH